MIRCDSELDVIQASEALYKAYVPRSDFVIYDDYCLDTLPVSDNNNKEHSMNYAQAVVQSPVYTDTAKGYIENQLYDLRWKKHRELREHFKLDGIFPKNKEEADKWFKAGNYRLVKNWETSKDDDDDCYCEDRSLSIRWGKDEPDHKGYEAAQKKLDAARQEVQDLIQISTDEEKRLEALRNFRSATFH
jgi:hypothetical protein